jgi:hypothetical protein
LNALTSDALVALVEAGLEAHGVEKVVPATEMLADAYTAFKRGAMAKAALNAELARSNAESVNVPTDLEEQVRSYLAEHPMSTWTDAVRIVVATP